MLTKTPQPVAFCWYLGKEMSRKRIEGKRCADPTKQINGVCKYLQWYGKKVTTPIVLERPGRGKRQNEDDWAEHECK